MGSRPSARGVALKLVYPYTVDSLASQSVFFLGGRLVRETILYIRWRWRRSNVSSTSQSDYNCERNVYLYYSQRKLDGTSLLVVTPLLLLERVCSCGQETRRDYPAFTITQRSERFCPMWMCFTCIGEAGNSRPPVEHLHWEWMGMPV